ncbi:TPA: sulfatase [Vibrio mimicus]
MKKPNLLYVFPDQWRVMALGIWQHAAYRPFCSGVPDPVFTPVLDNFIQQATLLTHAVSNCPLCSPHRGSLFTGQYPNKSGVPLNCHSLRTISNLPTEAECFTDVLSQSGYHIGYIGKWHLDYPTPNAPDKPGSYVEEQFPVWDSYTEPERRHHIDYWYGYGTFDEHRNPHYYDTQGKRHQPKTWSAEHEADKAIAYLLNQHGERDAQKPFALFVSMNPPHSPYNSVNDCRESDLALYQAASNQELLIRQNADASISKADSARYYFANISGVDKEIGRIFQALEEIGEWDNTVVVFTSDHGETLCSHSLSDAKNVIYDEALRVPFVIKTGHQQQSTISQTLLSSPDIMPTILGLLGVPMADPLSIDGRDLSCVITQPLAHPASPDCALYLRNQDGEKNALGEVIAYFPQSRGIRTLRYTLALEINRQAELIATQLFDNQTDPYQLTNLPFEPQDPFVKPLLQLMAEELHRIQDPWAEQGILASLLPYPVQSTKDNS